MFTKFQYTWEKLYKATPTCGREEGTLYKFRQQFRMTNVYKDIKKNYKSAEHHMLCSTKAYICSAFMTWAGLENISNKPCNVTIPPKHSTKVNCTGRRFKGGWTTLTQGTYNLD